MRVLHNNVYESDGLKNLSLGTVTVTVTCFVTVPLGARGAHILLDLNFAQIQFHNRSTETFLSQSQTTRCYCFNDTHRLLPEHSLQDKKRDTTND